MICFTDKEWEDYQKTSEDEQIEIQACLDCTVQFQLESLTAGLCRPINFGVTPIWRNDEQVG